MLKAQNQWSPTGAGIVQSSNIWRSGNVAIGPTSALPTYTYPLEVNKSTTNFLVYVKNANTAGKGLWVQAGNTTNATPVEVFRVSSVDNSSVDISSLIVRSNGKIGMGVNFTSAFANYDNYRLFVKDGIRTEKVKVDLQAGVWADYVFAPTYRLRPLSEVEAFIQQNKHLPDVPSAKTLEANGLDLAEMHKIQMQKIEELTLYLIELKKENEALKNQVLEIKKQLNQKKNE
jgi:hypothetical protein